MRSFFGRVCALSLVFLGFCTCGTVALGDIFAPPPVPSPAVPESEPAAADSSSATSPTWGTLSSDCNCGQPDCPNCCKTCCEPCCTSCCDNPWATWTFSAGALFMTRSNPDDAILFFNTDTNTGETLNASQFEFGWQPGVEFGVTRHRLFWNTDLELRLWSIDGWTAGASQSFSGPTTEIAIDPMQQLTGPQDVVSSYASRIGSLELNLKHRWEMLPRWKWIAGFRMLELDEHLDSLFSDPNGVNGDIAYNVDTRNRLYGFQLGGEFDVVSGCNWCVRGFLKGGIYGNEANNTSRIDCMDNPFCAFRDRPLGENKSRTAFVGETGISVKYCICDNLAVRADYRAIWVGGVALASEQINATSSLYANGASTSGDVFYHGGFLGMEYSF